MTILASHTLEIQNYLFIRFIIILLITKNITKIITKIAEVSQRFHFGASGSPKVSLAEVLVGKAPQSFHFGGFPALPPREARRPPKWLILKNPKHVKNFEFFLFFRFFSRFFHLAVMFFFRFFSDCFSFLVVPGPPPPEKCGGHQNGRFLANFLEIQNRKNLEFFSFFFRFSFVFFSFYFRFFFRLWWFPALLLANFGKIQNT